MHEVTVLFFAVASGLTLSGIVANIYKLVIRIAKGSAGNDPALDHHGISWPKCALRKRIAVRPDQKVLHTRLLLCDRAQPLLVLRCRIIYAQHLHRGLGRAKSAVFHERLSSCSTAFFIGASHLLRRQPQRLGPLVADAPKIDENTFAQEKSLDARKEWCRGSAPLLQSHRN